MTEKTATFGLRIPKEIKAKLTGKMTRECLEGIARQLDAGEIELNENGVVLPKAEDKDGEWVRDLAHDLNVDVKTFKRRIEQSVR